MATNANSDTPPMKYQSIKQIDVPKGRDGKHKQIVTQLLSDIEQLEDDRALRVPLEALPDTKENIRSALNRATRQRGIEVATSSDAEFLYIWKISDNIFLTLPARSRDRSQNHDLCANRQVALGSAFLQDARPRLQSLRSGPHPFRTKSRPSRRAMCASATCCASETKAASSTSKFCN